MKYQLKDFHRNIPESDLLDDLRNVARNLKTDKLSSREYNDNGGKYTAGTISARFGSWNIAIEKAGLKSVLRHNPSDKELFENLEKVWIELSRQPVSRDLIKTKSQSKFSQSSYINKFGTFRKALESFIEFINSEEEVQIEVEKPIDPIVGETAFKHKTKRNPSERLKVQVLMRDGNKCRFCGITLIGDHIHFDHIKPWSAGGETVLENLQILCDKHNLAKGNLDYNPSDS